MSTSGPCDVISGARPTWSLGGGRARLSAAAQARRKPQGKGRKCFPQPALSGGVSVALLPSRGRTVGTPWGRREEST